jgi:hypothetical protein
MQVLGEGIVVVTGSWLAGPSKSAAIIGNNTVAGVEKDWDLLLPGRAAKWVSVDQDDRLTGAVVFIMKMDGTGVLFPDINIWHRNLLSNASHSQGED